MASTKLQKALDMVRELQLCLDKYGDEKAIDGEDFWYMEVVDEAQSFLEANNYNFKCRKCGEVTKSTLMWCPCTYKKQTS